ncbi:hypothetical protein Bbelb_029890 [Branchiostoma belcheri]|nr:hypothetical protein Bbelb_029890 [Branchiostoma belcheri]
MPEMGKDVCCPAGSNAVYARPPLTFLEGPSYRSESFELHKILRVELCTGTAYTALIASGEEGEIFRSGKVHPRSTNAQSKFGIARRNGCKRFTSGHGVAGTVSGVKAAIHVGNELWFGVGIEVSERDQNLAISTVRNGPERRYTNACVTAIPTFATAKPTLKQRRLQRYTAKSTPVFLFFPPHFGRGDERCGNSDPVPTVKGTLQQSSPSVTGP